MINYSKLVLGGLLLLILVQSCKVKNVYTAGDSFGSPGLMKLRDSILQEALDGEALYTILGDIKPMSSVAAFSFPIANPDSAKRLEPNLLFKDSLYHLKRIERLQNAVNRSKLPDLKFDFIPFRNAYARTRTLQLSVVRVSRLDSLLEVQSSFFGQYGFTAGADPAVVVTVNEYEKKYQRLRGYGYLFVL